MKKNKPLLVGITGGIGSGKSTICKVFSTLGIPVYEADSRAKMLMTQDPALIESIKEAFGESAYTPEGQLNRQHIAAQVFKDGNKVSILNQLVHPKVGEDFRAWAAAHQAYTYLLNEAALMFESGRYQDLDKVITVFAPEKLRIERVSKRDTQRSREEIQAIIHKQLSEEEKITRADYVIHNDGKQLVIPQVLKLHKLFEEIHKGENIL